jgi:hypothetical protein
MVAANYCDGWSYRDRIWISICIFLVIFSLS